MCDVGDVGCWRCGMFAAMWDVDLQNAVSWGCGMLGMWDVRDVGYKMWDVDLQNAISGYFNKKFGTHL